MLLPRAQAINRSTSIAFLLYPDEHNYYLHPIISSGCPFAEVSFSHGTTTTTTQRPTLKSNISYASDPETSVIASRQTESCATDKTGPVLRGGANRIDSFSMHPYHSLGGEFYKSPLIQNPDLLISTGKHLDMSAAMETPQLEAA